MKTNTFLVISRFKENNLEWIKDYTDNYIIYNKGDDSLVGYKEIFKTNIGGNQRDIFEFIFDNYDNLPDSVAFLQAFPFDHCKKETLDKLILNENFTSLEDYSHVKVEGIHKKDVDGGYMELNNSWYIHACNSTFNQNCRYSSFDDFMNQVFSNYQHIEWIRFAPGSQYIIEKKQMLFYPKSFWKFLTDNLVNKSPTEGHIIERALWNILQCKLVLRG